MFMFVFVENGVLALFIAEKLLLFITDDRNFLLPYVTLNKDWSLCVFLIPLSTECYFFVFLRVT